MNYNYKFHIDVLIHIFFLVSTGALHTSIIINIIIIMIIIIIIFLNGDNMWEKYILFSSNILSVLTTFFPFFEDEINSFFRINIAFLQFFWIYFVFVDGGYTVWLLHHLPFKEVYIHSCPLCLPFLLLIFVCNGEFGVDTHVFI